MQISIVEFSIENFKSFKERATFSLLARKHEKHTFCSNSENLLKLSVIYGPNATGKSSLMDACFEMRRGISLSANNTESGELPYYPHLADIDSKDKPTLFEIVFSITESEFSGIYKYTFEYDLSSIHSERLTLLEEEDEKILFARTENKISVYNSFKEAEILVDRTRNDALFLSVASQFNIPIANELVNAVRQINILSGRGNFDFGEYTTRKVHENPEFKKKVLSFLKAADFSIDELEVEEFEAPGDSNDESKDSFSNPKSQEKIKNLSASHPVFNSNGIPVDTFTLDFFDESEGTQCFISLIGPIIDTLEKGKVLLIDEFDNSLHPHLTKFILDLFESKEINSKNAQLIVTTHDTNLLTYKEDLIKDHFWFTEKNRHGSSRLFSLAEFKLRNDTEYAKKYLEGRFGALPYISAIDD